MPPFLDLLEIVNRLTQRREPTQRRELTPGQRMVNDLVGGVPPGGVWGQKRGYLGNFRLPEPRYQPRSPWDVLAYTESAPPGIDAAQRQDINSIFQPARPVSPPYIDKYDVIPRHWALWDF